MFAVFDYYDPLYLSPHVNSKILEEAWNVRNTVSEFYGSEIKEQTI